MLCLLFCIYILLLELFNLIHDTLLPNHYNRWLGIQVVTQQFHSGAKLWKFCFQFSQLCFAFATAFHNTIFKVAQKINSFEWTSTSQSQIDEVSKRVDELLTIKRNDQTRVCWKWKCTQMYQWWFYFCIQIFQIRMYLTRRAYWSHQTSMNMKSEVTRHRRSLARNKKIVLSFVVAKVVDSP